MTIYVGKCVMVKSKALLKYCVPVLIFIINVDVNSSKGGHIFKNIIIFDVYIL